VNEAVSTHKAPASPPELTVRAVLLGGLITLVFTAANVYLGLKVGLTFATSIPAAVISMAVLRWFASSSILENNIVQTVASAAGTLAAICFVLPGLVMIGWWHGFPYWTTALITGLGGALGVLFSVPLRRALVTDSPLLIRKGSPPPRCSGSARMRATRRPRATAESPPSPPGRSSRRCSPCSRQ
jgi:putative OPT family oligopeptide transporter